MDIKDAITLKQWSRQAREDYAEEVFDVHVVASKIRRAAKLGRTSVRIPQDRALDLSGTTAASLLVLHLESLGFATSWEDARKVDASRSESVLESTYCELVVEWFERMFEGSSMGH
jgi:hypothetical protein